MLLSWYVHTHNQVLSTRDPHNKRGRVRAGARKSRAGLRTEEREVFGVGPILYVVAILAGAHRPWGIISTGWNTWNTMGKPNERKRKAKKENSSMRILK